VARPFLARRAIEGKSSPRLFPDVGAPTRAPAIMGPMPRSGDRITALTGLRPFASALVLVYHFAQPLVAAGPSWARAAAGAGYIAVSFFYVLSGFVLALAYGDRLTEGRFDRGRFFSRRLARIAPTYLFALLLLLPLALDDGWGRASFAFQDGHGHRALTGLLHLFAVQAWFPQETLSWNLPGWSISVEISFYLAFPALGAWLVRRSTRGLVTIAAVAWLGTLATCALFTWLAPRDPAAYERAVHVLKFWPPARLPEFVVGLAAGLCFARRGNRPIPPAVGLIALACILGALLGAEHIPYAILHNALLLPAFVALVWAVATARGPVAQLLNAPPLQRLGNASYAIFILQMPLMHWLLLVRSTTGVLPTVRGYVLSLVVLSVGAGLLVSRLLEPPARRAFARFVEGGRRVGVVG
jgi:peptidoglycan/LPS O-acetylase OafA/YrhL